MEFLINGFAAITWQHVVMWVIGGVLILLAIVKKLEPALLLPIGFGAILVNIPFSSAVNQGETIGILDWLFNIGIEISEAMPLILFIGIGAMIDFGPLLENPKLFMFGVFAQSGIFLTILIAAAMGFDIKDACAIGIIGAADGPTSIYVANVLGSKYFAPIMVVAYSYMALVPIIQPAVIKCLTTKKERQIRMQYNSANVSKTTRILFPIVITLIAGLFAPMSVSLVGCLMFGNLIRECGVLDNLSETASKVLSNLITLLLGISIASQMKGENFLQTQTLMIMALGLMAFILDTAVGVIAGKVYNIFAKTKINPMIGAAGISAFPMSARVVQKLGLEADRTNHLLMFSIGCNVSGQVASAIAGGIILSLML